jgi:GT2 family glycosyltransferase
LNAPTANVEQQHSSAPHVVTILVNWRGVEDTLECLESLLASDYPNQTIVVVDNGSGDGSLEKILAWAKGALSVTPKGAIGQKRLPNPCTKPVSLTLISCDELEYDIGWLGTPQIFLIDAKRNLGFAGGMNLGISFALSRGDVQFVWVLNNDTIVARDCLLRLVGRIAQDDAIGMCGCRVLYYDDPSIIQALGGARISRVLGRSRLIGNGLIATTEVNNSIIEKQFDHLCGVSMLVTRSFIQQVGPMEESYFLYYEEADWAERAKPHYRLAYADKAVVYHKEGASIGSSRIHSRRSVLSAYFLVKSRLRFTRRFHAWALPCVITYCLFLVARAFADGQKKQGTAMLAAIFGTTPKDLSSE